MRIVHIADWRSFDHTLGSVRQLPDPAAAAALPQSYEQFGEALTSAGAQPSNFRFAIQPVGAAGLRGCRA